MADTMTPEQRSRCMSHIRSKDTKPEMLVRKFLFSKGLRFRVNARYLPVPPILFSANTKPSSSSTAVSGTATTAADTTVYLHPTLTFGRTKSTATSTATPPPMPPSPPPVGASYEFGNAS